jgi:cell division septation protein DedD
VAEESRSAPREFQLETRHLAAIILIVAILCISSFMLGRWVERQSSRATAEGLRSGLQQSLSVEDVNKELTYFRTLEGEAPPPKVATPPPEPGRPAPVRVESPAPETESSSREADEDSRPETASTASSRVSPPSPANAAASQGSGVHIQVLATKDAAAARALRDRLSSHGFKASIAAGTSSSGAGISKVRVGPYASRAEAERAAKRLRAEEGLRTWIP